MPTQHFLKYRTKGILPGSTVPAVHAVTRLLHLSQLHTTPPARGETGLNGSGLPNCRIPFFHSPARRIFPRIGSMKGRRMPDSFAVIVAGGGLAGSTAALALAKAGFDVAAIAPEPAREDSRTTALLASSVAFLKELGVWDAVSPKTAPLATMRIIDATGRLFRAPELAFHASEIGLEAFGYNVANVDLLAALARACEDTGRVTFVNGTVEGAVFGAGMQQVTLQDGRSFLANLVVGADGRNSVIRRLCGAGEREWSYPQTALVLDFSHTLPHHDASTEFHTPEGPFTFVPLAPDRCGLVWVQRPEKAEKRMKWRKDELEREIERQMHSMLGKVNITSQVQAWRLSGLVAKAFGGPGWVLAGEAAHVFPPIGAQGFNLGIRDVELIASMARGMEPAALPTLGSRYNLRRVADVTSRTVSVDILNRSLLSGFLPIQLARVAGMHAINLVGPLRRLLMREGVAPGGQLRALSSRFERAG
jgi:2-octaprenyl-6-methoxyphenol hydroxylase